MAVAQDVNMSKDSLRLRRQSKVPLFMKLRSRRFMAYWLILPLLLIILGLVVYPFFSSIYLSMLNKSETKFKGLYNYERLLESDTFWLVVSNSFTFTLTAVFFNAILGLALALIINNLPARGQRIWRGIALIPWVMPVSLGTLGWWWIFEPTHSALNWVLVHLFGLEEIPWLSDPFWARFTVILTNIWFGTPFFMIMYLAGLQSIPEELYEASEIDGAGILQRFHSITLPLLRNIIAITMMFSTIVTFSNFDIVRVMTRGGPRYSTHLFGTYAFTLGIESGNIPRGAAVSLFMFPFLAIAAFIILRMVRRSAQ